MGCDTNGVVLTPVKDVLILSGIVEATLTKLIRYDAGDRFGFTEEARKEFALPSIRLSPSSGMVSFDFVFKGECRQLSMFFNCDCDHEDLAARSISLRLGVWGSSVEIMRAVLFSLSAFGDCYLDENDCGSKGLIKVSDRNLSLLDLVSLDVVRPHQFETFAQTSGFVSLGVSPPDLKKLSQVQGYSRQKEFVEALAKPSASKLKEEFLQFVVKDSAEAHA